MKKIKYFFFLLIFMTFNVNAKVINETAFENDYKLERAYVVGNYIFDMSKGFNPTLEDLLIASSYIKSNDVKVYEIKISKNINNETVKEYTELLSNEKLTSFPYIDIKYIYSGSIKNDKSDYKTIDDSMILTNNKSVAKELTKSEYADLSIERAYVLGDYLFDLSNNYNPSLKDLLIAATTSLSNNISVYELKNSENISGAIVEEYNELLSAKKLDAFPRVAVKYIYAKNIDGNPNRTLPYYDTITFNDESKVYTASKIEANGAVSENKLQIKYTYFANTDCTGAELDDGAINVGTYGVLATSIGTDKYLSATACAKLNITPLDASDSDVTFRQINNVYSGSEIKPEFSIVKNGITLINDRDYTYKYSDNINAGNGKLTVTYKGNYKGTQDATFAISKLNIELYSSDDTKIYDDAIFEKSDVSYCNLADGYGIGEGDSITSCVVKSTETTVGSQDLLIDSYQITKNGVNVNDNYTVTLRKGSVDITKRVTTCTLEPKNKVYDGTKLETFLVCTNLVDNHQGKTTKTIPTLINVADSTIFSLEKTEVAIFKGDQNVTNNYDITVSNGGQIPLVIKAKNGSGNSHIIVDYEYDHVTGDGTPKTPRITRIYDEELNAVLVENESYTYTYFNNINVGTGEIRITFKGNYQGEKTVTFAIE